MKFNIYIGCKFIISYHPNYIINKNTEFTFINSTKKIKKIFFLLSNNDNYSVNQILPFSNLQLILLKSVFLSF